MLITYKIFTTFDNFAKKIFEIMKLSHSILMTTNFLFSKNLCVSIVTLLCKTKLISFLHHVFFCLKWLFNKTTYRRMFSNIFKTKLSKWKCFSWIDFFNFSISISLKKYELSSNDEFINVDSNSRTRKIS